MGRIQDAMKRAAEEAAGKPRDARALANETFPEEAAAETAPALDSAEAAEFEAGELALSPPEEAPRVNGSQPPASGVLQTFPASLRAKIVVDATMQPSSREQYRRLAAALHHAKEASGLKVVMIASAVAGEGKSLTASNLALTFSESYQRSVLLIDGDLRRPSLHRLFKIDAPGGLGDALMEVEDTELALYQVSERLSILPAGKPNSDPMAGLTSVRMRRVLDEAREGFDWVFIDTPPVGLLSDANLLSAMVDATVLVIRADRTPFHLVQRAVDALGPDRILGAVLNQATATLHGYAYEYYHYYEAPRAEPVKRGA